MTRVLSGAVLVVLAVGVVWLAPPPVFLAAAFVLVLLAAGELIDLARAGGLAVPKALSVAAALVTLAASVAPFFTTERVANAVALLLAVELIAIGGVVMSRWAGQKDALATVAAALMPSLYVAVPIGALVALRQTHGPPALFLMMLTVMVSDTAQYYSGRLLGRTPLAPAVSPKKTVEGAIGGFAVGTIVFAGTGMWWLPQVSTGFRALIGCTLVALGIAGDLFESMLKRSAGVKDSSAVIPGHGGVLDRIDALLFAAPVYYLVLQFV